MRSRLTAAYRTTRELAKMLLVATRSRRVDVCCCGLSKTGTHSLAGIFENYRSEHHPDADVRMRLATGLLRGEIDVDTLTRVLRRRDRLLGLEMESSALAGVLIEPLAKACPKKKFILTIRDVFSWCDSWIDHGLNRPANPASPWLAFDRVRLRVDEFPATPFDQPLIERGLFPLACYFQLWTAHNRGVLEAVPSDRLLVLRTHEISDRMHDIATWANVSPTTLRGDRNWLFAAPTKHHVLSTLDPAYVQDVAERHCRPLLTRLFPGIVWRGSAAEHAQAD